MDKINMSRRVLEFRFKGRKPIAMIENKMVQTGTGRQREERDCENVERKISMKMKRIGDCTSADINNGAGAGRKRDELLDYICYSDKEYV
jgi:hypothetical protein